jgi:transcriptional regulator with XRE-family HTH domain
VTDLDEQKLYQLVGRRIRDLRVQRNPKLTQARLASLLQIERTSVTNIESGTQRPPLALLYRLCVELDVPLQEVLPDPGAVRVRRLPSELHRGSPIPPKTAHVISKLSAGRGKATRSRE